MYTEKAPACILAKAFPCSFPEVKPPCSAPCLPEDLAQSRRSINAGETASEADTSYMFNQAPGMSQINAVQKPEFIPRAKNEALLTPKERLKSGRIKVPDALR